MLRNGSKMKGKCKAQSPLTVAVPGARDAEAGGGALELALGGALVRRQRRAARLVRPVVAVRDAVALVRLLRTERGRLYH